MHIEVVGQGPALVLIHGWALHSGVFAPLREQLAAHCQLHLVDLPGHGRSRDDSTALKLPYVVSAIAAATPPAVWCGWSLGGLFALHAAATLPQVRGLAMIAALPRITRADDWPHAAPPSALAQLGHDLQHDHHATVERFLALDLMAAEQPRTELQAVREALASADEPAPRIVPEGLALLHNSDLRRALHGLRIPSLWLAGQRDRLVPARAMQDAAALAPHAQLHVIAGGGHAPFLSRPDQVAEQLQQFVAACQ